MAVRLPGTIRRYAPAPIHRPSWPTTCSPSGPVQMARPSPPTRADRPWIRASRRLCLHCLHGLRSQQAAPAVEVHPGKHQQVGHRGDHPASRAKCTDGDPRAGAHGAVRGEVVTQREAVLNGVGQSKCGAAQTERSDDESIDHAVEGAAAEDLDEAAERDVAGVAVGEELTRLRDRADARDGRREPGDRITVGTEVVPQIALHPTRVVQQPTDRHAVGQRRELGHELIDRGVQRNAPLFEQQHHGGRGEDLRHRRHLRQSVCGHRLTRVHVRNAVGSDNDPVVGHHSDNRSGHAMSFTRVAQQDLEVGLIGHRSSHGRHVARYSRSRASSGRLNPTPRIGLDGPLPAFGSFLRS